MKKCNSVIFLLVFVIGFVGLLTMLNVRATDDANIGGIGGDYQGGSQGSGTGGGTGDVPEGYGWWEISDINGNSKEIYGIRVSFVDSDGNNLGSVDYIDGDTYPRIFSGLKNSGTLPNATINIVKNRCSKVGYASGDCRYYFTSVSKDSSSSTYFKSLDTFIEYFKNIKLQDGSEFTFTNADSSIKKSVIPSKEANYNYSTIFDFLINDLDLTTQRDQEIVYELFKRLFDGIKSVNKDLDDYRVPGDDELFDLFLVFEPVTVFALDGDFYIGTAYELAAKAKEYDFVGVDAMSRLKLPCASYLTGNLATEIPSSSISYKFSTSSYFNEKININSGVSQSCSSGTRLDGNVVASVNSSVGMGVIWLSSYIKETLPDNLCEYIKENSNWNSSLSSEFDRLYNSGGVDAILNRYQNITYRDENGENQQISAYWFVHQCTCYGMYEYYGETRAPSYTAQNQTNITRISRIFGDQNWYIEPSLSDVYQGAFPEDRFGAYNLQVKRYLNSHNLGELPFDNVTEEKFRELNCGSTTMNWCTHYNNWHDSIIDEYNLDYPTISEIRNASEEYILNEYKDQFQTMLDAYNLVYSPINGFSWTINQTGNKKQSYFDECLGNNQGVSCAVVDQFYGNRINDELNCQTVRNFDFSAFNNRYGTSITGNWYANYCGCVEVTPKNCTPNNNVGTCLDEGSISYQDSSQGIIDDEYWNSCVFNDYGQYDVNVHKVADQNSSLSYYDDNLSNEYCEIYCIEDVSASLPSRNVTVEAGRWFTLDNGYVNGSRTCRTKSIDWEQFEEDLAEANRSGNASAARGIVEKMKNCYFSIDQSLIEGGFIYGDINQDGEVTPSDYLLLRRFVLGIETPSAQQIQIGDVDLDGKLTDNDYQIVKEYILNLSDTLVYPSSFDADDLYKVDPKATIIYSDNTYSYSGELKATTTYGEIKNEMVNCVKKNS